MDSEATYAATIIRQRPALLDRFEVLGVLGEGAGSVVYLVRDRLKGNREVALKVLINTEAFDEYTLKRFEDEFKVSQSIKHRNLVEAYDLIRKDHVLAYTMEHVSGDDLGRIFNERMLSLGEIESIVGQVLLGLHELHNRSIVHRDLKLENILVTEDGLAKISDLGLMKQLRRAALTEVGVLLGTAPYLPPEYIRKGRLDARSDLYAVGIILYELLTGERRLEKLEGAEALSFLLKTNFALPKDALEGVPLKYLSVLENSTAIRPDERYESALKMREALLKPMGVKSGSPSKLEVSTKGGKLSKLFSSLSRFLFKVFTLGISVVFLVGAGLP